MRPTRIRDYRMCKVIKDFFKIIAIFILFGSNCFGQDITVQQNQQNVNINLPVMEKTVYVDRYRTVYVDKPQPIRVAKKLSAPIQLLGYLWVYPEDLGNFKQIPFDVINSINEQNMYGRDNWRTPTPDELAVLENNADKVGLGDDIYLATDHSNGVLRLVSTGKTKATSETDNQAIRQEIINSGKGVELNGIIWATSNVGASSPKEFGYYYTWENAKNACPKGWRLPTKEEFESLIGFRKQVDANNEFGIGENTIFLPLAGIIWTSSNKISNIGQYGYYWSSTDPYTYRRSDGGGIGKDYDKAHSLNFGVSYSSRISGEDKSDAASCRCVLDEE